MSFKDITGNNRVKRILRRALVKDRVPNSLLFCGPEGVGKKETALVVAKALNCETSADDACEECSSCRAINNHIFPDVMEISPDGEAVKIEQMRLLKQMAYLKPMAAKRRIFIVYEAQSMTDEAANSLLKVLEEPPLFSHIILVTSNLFLILPTIRSRCQTVKFSSISKGEVEQLLTVKGYSEEKAKIISFFVRGNLELATSLEWEEVERKRSAAWSFFSSLVHSGGESSSFLESYAFSRRGLIKKDLEETLEIFSSFSRDCLLIKKKGDVRFLINPDYETRIRDLERSLTYERLLNVISLVDQAIAGLDRNLNTSLLVSSLYSSIIG